MAFFLAQNELLQRINDRLGQFGSLIDGLCEVVATYSSCAL